MQRRTPRQGLHPGLYPVYLGYSYLYTTRAHGSRGVCGLRFAHIQGGNLLAAKVSLEVVSGPIKGEVFEFEDHDTFLFGRGKDCHARLPKDGYVSRHHFMLEVNPPQAAIRDLGSLNGICVNGVRYGGRKKGDSEAAPQAPSNAVVELRHGDAIRVGKTKITVKVDPPPPAAAKPPRAAPGRVEKQIEKQATAQDGKAGLYVPTRTEARLIEQSAPVAPAVELAPDSEGQDSPLPTTGAAAAAEKQASPSEFGLRRLIQKAAEGYQDGPRPEIEGYVIEEVLGEGAMGTVYRATRTCDAFPVAIKTMRPRVAVNEKARQRFLREIDAIRELNHAHIATLLDSGTAGKAFYFVMDYCNGGSVADLAARQGGRLALQVLAPMMLQAARGLEHAHRRGFVHRDLKPANILIHQQGIGWTAKLGDFGLAKHFEQAGLSGMTLTGVFGGTYNYMPREQLTDFRSAKPVSDVWSMGATFYRLLAGCAPRECPEDRDPMEVVLREKSVPIRQRNPQIPPGVARVIDLSLANDLQSRYQDGAALRQALEEVLA